jgi:hypothetical protein
MEQRPLEMEGSSEYIKEAVADSQKWVVLANVLSPGLRWESQETQGCVYQAAVIKYSF